MVTAMGKPRHSADRLSTRPKRSDVAVPLLSDAKITQRTAFRLDWMAVILDSLAEKPAPIAQMLNWLASTRKFNLSVKAYSGKRLGAGGIFRGV
jgi:hypothetical protein